MVYRCVQLVLPLVQVMQDFSSEVVHPPHTTSLPPDKREMVWPSLGPSKSGMEHMSEEGGGKISTNESWSLFQPPATTCPDVKIVKDNVTRKTQQTTKMRNLSVHLFPSSYFGIGSMLKI